MKEKLEVDVVLFGIEHGGDVKREYPELGDIPEFKDLLAKEVRFCWLVGNLTSPLFKLDKHERVRQAVEIVYGVNYKKQPRLVEIANGEIPDELINGIKRMTTFSPEYRLRAKLMDQYIFDKLNKIIVRSDAEIEMMDIDDKRKYTELVIKVSNELKDMVGRLENAYGIKTVSRKTKEKVLVNIEQVI